MTGRIWEDASWWQRRTSRWTIMELTAYIRVQSSGARRGVNRPRAGQGARCRRSQRQPHTVNLQQSPSNKSTANPSAFFCLRFLKKPR